MLPLATAETPSEESRDAKSDAESALLLSGVMVKAAEDISESLEAI